MVKGQLGRMGRIWHVVEEDRNAGQWQAMFEGCD